MRLFTYFVMHKFLYTTSRAVLKINAEKITGRVCCDGLFFDVVAVGLLSANTMVYLGNDIY